jgi:hypothetical protein
MAIIGMSLFSPVDINKSDLTKDISNSDCIDVAKRN